MRPLKRGGGGRILSSLVALLIVRVVGEVIDQVALAIFNFVLLDLQFFSTLAIPFWKFFSAFKLSSPVLIYFPGGLGLSRNVICPHLYEDWPL